MDISYWLITIPSVVAIISAYPDKNEENKRVWKLKDRLVFWGAIIFIPIAIYGNYLSLKDNEDELAKTQKNWAESKKEASEAKDEIIKYQKETLKKILGDADSLYITTEPFYSYKRDMVCYQFKISNGSTSGVYDLSVRYFQPSKTKKTLIKGMRTDKYFDLWKVANIENLPPLGEAYFGKPFIVKNNEVLNYRFHINSRSGMYYQSTIAIGNKSFYLDEARKRYKFEDIANGKLIAIDSFIPKEIPVNLYDKKYTW